jgi:O-antigen/teichoic acid export membrane protein
MGMKAKAARGVLWSLLEYGGGEGISFIIFLVLARLVAPSDFGVVALAGVFVAFVQLFLIQGFSDAVIQRQDLRPEHIDTAFWSNVGIAMVFFLPTVAGAGVIAELFRQPLLEDVLRWLSLVFVSTALISTHQAVFKRDFQFRAFALRALIGISVGGGVGMTMAAMGFGVWSLVGQQLANGFASVVVMWSSSHWRPRIRFSVACFRDMAGFAANVIGSNLVGFAYKKLDVFLIGYFLDAKSLGYYYLVQRLLMTMGLVTLSTIQSIVMPVLSRLQDDRQRFCDAFATTVQLTQTVWLPMVLGLGLVSAHLIPLLFGEQWRPTIPVLQVMSLTAFTAVFSFFSGQALYAAGRPQAYLRLALIQVAITAALFVPGAMWGLGGVAIAYVAVSLLIIPAHLMVLKENAGIEPIELLRCTRAPVLAAIAMGIVVAAVETSVTELSPIVMLAVEVSAGAAAYLAVLGLAAPGLVKTAVGMVESALGRPPVPAA